LDKSDIVPNIQFSNTISKTQTDDHKSGYRYRFKFENSGRRSIVDLEIIAKLRIKGLKSSYPNNWQVIYIPLEYDRIPQLHPVKKEKLREAIQFSYDKTNEFSNTIYPDYIRQKVKDNTLSLEDILSLGTDRTLQVFVFGYDEFSGTRRVFQSKLYKKNDIKVGKFDSRGLEVL